MVAYFWDQRAPHVVRHDIERRTGTLLDHDPARTHPLVYAGNWMDRGRIELRLESSTLNGTLYSLRFDGAADHTERFRDWLRDLGVIDDPGNVEYASGARYDELVRMALEFEAKKAAVKEDLSKIAAARDAVLDALRGGKRYRRAEGGPEGIFVTTIQWEGDRLVKREIGETETVEIYSTEADALAFLRSYFDFDACRDTFPHKPPETEIWKYIGYQLK
jgi:hypothetical protein